MNEELDVLILLELAKEELKNAYLVTESNRLF